MKEATSRSHFLNLISNKDVQVSYDNTLASNETESKSLTRNTLTL
ncbi:hypothetical protein [Rubritalea tangerina]